MTVQFTGQLKGYTPQKLWFFFKLILTFNNRQIEHSTIQKIFYYGNTKTCLIIKEEVRIGSVFHQFRVARLFRAVFSSRPFHTFDVLGQLITYYILIAYIIFHIPFTVCITPLYFRFVSALLLEYRSRSHGQIGQCFLCMSKDTAVSHLQRRTRTRSIMTDMSFGQILQRDPLVCFAIVLL